MESECSVPHASALTVMPRLPRWKASTRVSWCSAALDAEYEKVSSDGTRTPSTEPIMMTRAVAQT